MNIEKIKAGDGYVWLDKGEGGEWYEPYVTNRDMVMIAIITLIGMSMIILGGLLI